jgi:ribosomal-protein-alanine N-acetyltransferase
MVASRMGSTLFETPRLLARRWTFDDAPAVLALFSDPEVARFLPGAVMADLDAARAMVQRNLDRYVNLGGVMGGFALVEKNTGAIVGNTLIKPLPDGSGHPTTDIEIGWHLARAQWGRGYATEGARACLDYGFETLHLPIIHAVVDPRNERSLRVARRLGMIHRGQTDAYYGQTVEWFSLAPGLADRS